MSFGFKSKAILLDDEMYEALTFREILLVQRLDDGNQLIPESVGGLCLDIQKAVGKPPEERKCNDICERLARIMNSDKDNNQVVPIDKLKTENIPAGYSELIYHFVMSYN